MTEDNLDVCNKKKIKHIHDIPKSPINNKKRRLSDDEDIDTSPSKKNRTSRDVPIIPKGLIWDPDNYSCAYDALFTIMHSIWTTQPPKWKERLELINNTMKYLISGFEQASIKQLTLEHVRDNIRHILHKRKPESFPYKHVGTDIIELTHMLCDTDDVVLSFHYQCIKCKHIVNTKNNTKSSLIYYGTNIFNGTTADYLYSRLIKTNRTCDRCNGKVQKSTKFYKQPPLIIFALQNNNITISKDVHVNNTIYHLKGIVYYGGFHFISRIITSDNKVWLHDGIETKDRCQYDGKLDTYNDSELVTCNNKYARIVMYALID